jgi:V/A-type H+-transporting ATPase subunit I
LESLQALEPNELKNCFAVGVVQNNFIPKLNEYLKRYPETYSRATQISNEESLLFVFGNEEGKKWIDALFLIYEIKDIFDVLDPGDVLLVLDPKKRNEAIAKYKTALEMSKISPEGEASEEKELWENESAIDTQHEKNISKLKEQYYKKITANEEKWEEEIAELQESHRDILGKILHYYDLLNVYRRKNVPVLRGKVVSVIQGYTPEVMIPKMREAIREVESEYGEILYVEVSDLGEHDHHAPVPEKDFRNKSFQPLWILTRLRGWPSAAELNPGHILVLVFCFQFGLMFGDIGQGLVFLAIGLALRNKFDKGMMNYLTTLFIPIGISAIIFGFMYDSFFLIEHGISHWLHEAHIELPFHYPIMPNPIKEVGKLMNLIFLVGALELVLGALLGAANAAKAKNYVGMLGEHGFGMGLYVTGLYLSASTMFTEGINVMAMVGKWPFQLMLAGMGLSFIEPVLHSIQHGHGVGMESIGEGLGGLLMTFVEGLANMFSFLRIAAFALAHVSLSVASEQLGHAIGSPILALVIMNIIALSFEFVSSSVQSLRLLYYEFMGKFYHGEGRPFKPFTIRKTIS